MSGGRTVPDGSSENPDLRAMHRDLVALVRRLEESIDAAPDVAAIEAIIERMAEVNSRVTATGRVLFAERTEEIARHARAVSAAIPEVEKEIDHLEDAERTVRSVAALLGTVDEAVRIARLACG